VLVRAATLFGITEGAARVALTRMVAAGELAVDDGVYRLTGPRLLERQARQASSRRAATRRWNGRWVLAVVVAERRDAADRAELRDRLRTARLGELREGVWARPRNLELDWAQIVHEHCTIVDDARVDHSVVGTLWDLDGWTRDATNLRAQMTRLLDPLERGDTSALADGFVVSAAVLRHFQADPLLPPPLLPRRWPGRALRDDYDRFDAAYRALLRAWFRRNR
jgi:phenylacetic acid degradation operon negative regulatory protein